MKNGIVIIGAGGHAKVIMSTLRACEYEIFGFVDDRPELQNTKIHGVPVIGYLSVLKELAGQPAVLGIGNNLLRKKIAASHNQLLWQKVIHPSAIVDASVVIGKGTVVFAGAVIQIDTQIGEHAIINTSASVDHDCKIADYAHIAPGTHLAGGVTVEEGAFLGINSCAVVGTAIGKWSTVGAGSVIIKSIEAEVFAKGVPAKPYRAYAQS